MQAEGAKRKEKCIATAGSRDAHVPNPSCPRHEKGRVAYFNMRISKDVSGGGSSVP